MPRIIAGELGGRYIPGPPGDATRPTSDRVREALFSRLEGWNALRGARVLDLYAGTGALAFEALSRGAVSAHVVDSGPKVVAALKSASRDLGIADRVHVTRGVARQRAQELARQAAGSSATVFDLVFLDPPYDVPTNEIVELLTDLKPALTDDALVIIERSTRTTAIPWPEGFQDDGTKKYGDTALYFGGPAVAPSH